MQREVTDSDNTTWTCVQAYAGLGTQGPAAALAERAADEGKPLPVVCTPTGGAQSVRLSLPAGWHADMSDDDLRAAIAAGRAECGEENAAA